MAKVSKKTTNKKKSGSNGSGKRKRKQPDLVDFHYLKGPDFRTIHVDGAIGGITPRGVLHIAMYSERPAIPKQIVHEVEGDGSLGPEVSRSSKSGIVRQMEVDVFLTEETARNLKVWLDQKLEEFEANRDVFDDGGQK